jgi:hypothetical protein
MPVIGEIAPAATGRTPPPKQYPRLAVGANGWGACAACVVLSNTCPSEGKPWPHASMWRVWFLLCCHIAGQQSAVRRSSLAGRMLLRSNSGLTGATQASTLAIGAMHRRDAATGTMRLLVVRGLNEPAPCPAECFPPVAVAY